MSRPCGCCCDNGPGVLPAPGDRTSSFTAPLYDNDELGGLCRRGGEEQRTCHYFSIRNRSIDQKTRLDSTRHSMEQLIGPSTNGVCCHTRNSLIIHTIRQPGTLQSRILFTNSTVEEKKRTLAESFHTFDGSPTRSRRSTENLFLLLLGE